MNKYNYENSNLMNYPSIYNNTTLSKEGDFYDPDPNNLSKFQGSPDKSSKQIMKRVFDEEFALNSSARKKSKSPLNTEKRGSPSEFDKMNTMAANLLKMSLLENNNNEEIPKNIHIHAKSEKEVFYDDELDLEVFEQSYKTFLNRISADSEFQKCDNDQKIKVLLEHFTHEQTELAIGSSVFLWEILYKYKSSLNQQNIELILDRCFSLIEPVYLSKNFYLLISLLEIIAVIGPNETSFANIKAIAQILKNSQQRILATKAFLALISLDYPGFYSLIYILNRDFTDLPEYLFNKLANTEDILLHVILPSLLNDIVGPDTKKRVYSLNALNRMYHLIAKSSCLSLLVNLLKEGTLDRQLIASCIKASGDQGEQLLLKLLKTSSNASHHKLILSIISVLSWRLPIKPKVLPVKIVDFQVAEHYKQNPGTMCIYHGELVPCAFEGILTEKSEESWVEINSRDFISALHRLLSVKYEKFQTGLREKHFSDSWMTYDIRQEGVLSEFTLVRLIDPSILEVSEEKLPLKGVSPEIIKILTNLFFHENSIIREQAISSIGIIGLPEALESADQLIKCLSDTDVQVRAMAAWAIGMLGPNLGQKAKKLIDCLKDSYWKVRNAACIAIGNVGFAFAEEAFPALTKMLRDGTINKLVVCETIVKLGVVGEQILIDVLRTVQSSNFKVKTAVIEALGVANVSKPTVDFVIEEVFKHASEESVMVRKASLGTLSKLRSRSQKSEITYLKSKNILPLFYYFLQDTNSEIREVRENL